MSDFCIYIHSFPGNYYEPPEEWCDLGHDEICGEDCPYRCSKEDYNFNYADFLYDEYKASLDFL